MKSSILVWKWGSNVLLYLDDIQHTNPEFLQKFIALCDGTRRIEGVWQGKPKTYDMRGKKFAVVMAGNPYTESGEAFKIPDMLANRADIYNLGDILSDQQDAFELSYIENALTSNVVLQPLATRNLNDLYKMVNMAKGVAINHNELEYGYTALEVAEIVSVLQKMLKVQAVLLRVNQQYIASAAMVDHYRTEPPFKLQGSYRNMNKLAEKIVSALSDQELDVLISDHYQGEAQTLTTGAEENLLKLAELRGGLNDHQQQRWLEIKSRFARHLDTGGEVDPQLKMVYQLSHLNQHIQEIGQKMGDNSEKSLFWQEKQIEAAMAIAAEQGAAPSLDMGQSIKHYLDGLTLELKSMSEALAQNAQLQTIQAQLQKQDNEQENQHIQLIVRQFEGLVNSVNGIATTIAEQPRFAPYARPNDGFILRAEGRTPIDEGGEPITK